MVNHSLFQRGFILSFLFILFFTDVGYTATNTDQLSSTDGAAQQSTASSAGTPADASTNQAAAPVIAAVETTTGDNSLPSLHFPSVAAEPNTGAATAAIQIETPPGRKGIQPGLSLQYNSNSENGWVGVGWDVPGSFIKRNTKYSVNYSANDYVHDSAELVARPDWGGNCYGRKIEGAFSKYYFNATTGGWEVTLKDGTKYYYGATTDSRQDNIYGVFKWMLDKVQDTDGNYMTLSYWKDQGEIYLGRIDYTGFGALSPTNYVEFYCETRTDAPTLYTSNVAVKTAYRLKTIDVVANGSKVRVYALKYKISDDTKRSLLESVQQYGTDAVIDTNGTILSGNSLPVTVLDYSAMPKVPNKVFNWVGSLGTTTNCYDGGTPIVVGDFDGDGKHEPYCYYNGASYIGKLNNNNQFVWTNWGPGGMGAVRGEILVGDFNGDGKSDVYCLNTNTDYVGVSTGTGQFSWYAFYHNCGCSNRIISAGDFDGDGTTELLQYDNLCRIFIGEFTGTAISWNQRCNTATGGCTFNASYGSVWMGDFNGDGKTDFATATMGTALWRFTVGISDGTNFNEKDWGDTNFEIPDNMFPDVLVGDFNGDGKDDMMIAVLTATFGWKNMVGLSTGSKFEWQEWASHGYTYNDVLYRVGDFNGDGRSDLYYFCNNGTSIVGLSIGNSFNWEYWGWQNFG